MRQPPSPGHALAPLAARFFDAWVGAEPEEATTLGLASAAPRLRDPSVAAEATMARVAEGVLAELDALERGQALGPDERLDAWALRAHATERVRARARGHASATLEAGPYAVMMLAHAAAHARSAAPRATVAARLEALPAYVAAAEAALREGLREARPIASSALEVVASQLDGAAADLAAIVDAAFEGAPAEPSHGRARAALEPAVVSMRTFVRFLRGELATGPGASDVVPLGAAEYERRLAAWWGIDDRAALASGARRELERARHDMVELGARAAEALPGERLTVRSFDDVAPVLERVMAPRPPSGDAVLEGYQREIERATAFCREHRLFAIPEPCRCLVVRSPELWRRFSPCTNWPAPLLGGDEPGVCAVLADPALHPLVNVPGLAVHEAIPGHFLQSRAWQLRFGGARAPVRFLSVPDECGVLHGGWIPHFMIEGWAVFAEARMEEAGFLDASSALFGAFCRAIHAARGLADMGLHAEGWSRAEVGAFLSQATGMPLSMCTTQAVRFARSGLQAWGYMGGRLALERLREAERARLGASFDELAFQSWLLDAGPVPPALLARSAQRAS